MNQIILHPGQQLVADCKARFRVVRHGRRWGGTTLCLDEALRHARQNRGSMVAVIVPFKRMARAINWPMLKDRLERGEIMTINSKMVVHLVNGSTIMVVAAEDDCALWGIGLDFAVFDVAAMMKPDMWFRVVRPALSDRCGGALFCFTPPHDRKGVDRAQWLRDIEDMEWDNWATFQFGSASSPYACELESARAELPADVFRVEFRAEWPE